VPHLVLSHMVKWFAANYLVINLDKINIMKFLKKNLAHSTFLVEDVPLCLSIILK
jgi:hypothetical protein